MIVGKIVGSVISTRKNENLVGSKFMIVEPVSVMSQTGAQLVAVDTIGAGIGELVLVSMGTAARLACDNHTMPVDAAIVGIVDDDCNKF
ncbi:MAG: EutN/CcmL family microcompartment protein [Faecalibacterium sp.]